jgi:hypothetical protein
VKQIFKSINDKEDKMSKLRAGDVLSCEVCGLSVIVDEECGCAVVDVMCCDEPMVYKGPAVPKKKALAAIAPKKKAAVKKVKPAAKKKVVKKAPKKAVKKPVVKKKARK